jgi:hypothetical protein
MATAAEKLKTKLDREEVGRSEDHALRDAIEAIALVPGKTSPKFEKLRLVRDLILKAFSEKSVGTFFHTSDGVGYFFSNVEKKVHPILAEDAFGELLKNKTGLSRIEDYYKFAIDTINTYALKETPTAEVHVVGHYNRVSHIHYVSNGGAGLLMREKNGTKWVPSHNGTDSVYFYTDAASAEFNVEKVQGHKNLDWFWSKFSFHRSEIASELTPSESKQLMATWLLQQLFPEFRRTRIIPAFLGPMGSGKTTAMKLLGGLILGRRFEPITINEKQENYIAAITRRVVAGFDNADTRNKWLEDALATYATGMEAQMRRLFRTNEEARFPIRAIAMITSRDPKFKRPDVAQRLLTVTYSAPADIEDEETIFEEMLERRGAIWSELLQEAACYADALNLEEKYKVKFRMADFGTFFLKGAVTDDERAAWRALLAKLGSAQAEFATSGDAIGDAIAELLEDNPAKKEFTYERTLYLYNDLLKIHQRSSEGWFPDSAVSFGKFLANGKPMLELNLGVTITIGDRAHAGLRSVKITRKNTEPREPGDESEVEN